MCAIDVERLAIALWLIEHSGPHFDAYTQPEDGWTALHSISALGLFNQSA